MEAARIVCILLGLHPRLSTRHAEELAQAFVQEAGEQDPVFLVALAEHESGVRRRAVSATQDFGLLQVHCAPPCAWTPEQLADPRTNVRLAAAELGRWRAHHASRCRRDDHPWWAHYNWGARVYRSGRHAGYPRRVQRAWDRVRAVEARCR